MEINLKSWIQIIFVLLVGLQLCYHGWRTYKHNQKLLSPIEKFALWLLRIFVSQEAALKRESELLSPKRVRLMGLYALIIGSLAVIGGLIGIAGLILMMI